MPLPLEEILNATKVRDVTGLLTSLSSSLKLSWVPFGGNDNNLATINLGSDPAAGLVERITNAFDAVLELEWEIRGRSANVKSPRQAAAAWFDIPEGRLATVVDIRSSSLSSVIERVSVTLRDSDRRDRPAVDIRDEGIGIAPDEFPSTILSLNRSRKLKKLYLAGAYGQGGSTALSYSPYTMILSRAYSEDERSNPVGFTIVRFNPGDPDVDKHGRYEYLVDASTLLPLALDVPLSEFIHGTLVRHIGMELGKYQAVMTAPTRSLWYLCHNHLFDPVLPFRIVEARSNSGSGARRSVTGNHRLLTHADHTEYYRQAALTFRSGTVRITWWVLSADGEDPRNRITPYVLPSKPIIVTFNGQKQGDLPNTVIKKDLGLAYLERYLVVHVDCDELDAESRRHLFPTTREALRDTPIGDDLRTLVVDTLAGDPELARLDRERKQRYMRRVDSAAVDNIRRRLARRIRSKVLTGGRGKGPRTLPPEGREFSENSSRTAIPVQEPPSFIEIANPLPRRIYPGRRFTLRFRTDADPAYFLHPESFIALVDPPMIGQYSGTTNLEAGYGTAYFQASEEVEVGSEGVVTLEIRPHAAKSLHADARIEVVALPSDAGGKGTGIATPHINPMWVTKEDDFWRESGWTSASVASVIRTEDSVDIFVSADNKRLNALLSRAQRRDVSAVESVKDFYLEHISFHSLLADLDAANFDMIPSKAAGGEDVDAEAIVEGELARACETICGMMEDAFDLIAVERSKGSTPEVLPAPQSSSGPGAQQAETVEAHR